MSTLDISEYVDSSHGNLIEPPIAHQTLEIGDEPVSCKPLNKLARIVRVVSDVDCLVSISIGKTKPSQFLRRDTTEVRIVQPEAGFVISAVAAGKHSSSGGGQGLWSFGDLSHALALIANPAAAKERLDAIAEAMAQAQALIAEANKQVAMSAATTKAHQEETQKRTAACSAAIAEAQQAFDMACQQREVALTAREIRAAEQESKLEADREVLEELHNDLQARAQAFARATEPKRPGRKPA
jgi:hypothetical protein